MTIKHRKLEPKADGTVDLEELEKALDARNWSRVVLHPKIWLHQANVLYYAANRLYDINRTGKDRSISKNVQGELRGQDLIDFLDGSLYPVYLLLVGYAVENLIKGITHALDPGAIKILMVYSIILTTS
jgi:hypothetical protein